MYITDLFIKRPVLATVISLLILVFGIRSMLTLSIRQYPFTQNAVITVTTYYIGADPATVAGFITTPLEQAIAQANGIDYMASRSVQSASTIQVYLQLNYDSNKALADINSKINAVLNQLPKNAQIPAITVSVGQTIDAMYLSFYSKILPSNQITDYLIRVVQPKFQAIDGVQVAEILGSRQFAMRIWLDPQKLAGFGLTSADVANALATNDVTTAAGRTDGQMFTVDVSSDTGLTKVEEFKNMVIKSQNGAIIRLRDIAAVSLGATSYDSNVSFNGKEAVYMGIQVTPTANILNVINEIKKIYPTIVRDLPEGLNAKVTYDSTEFISSSINEVVRSLLEAMIIVTVVIFLFLGSIRSVFIPVIAIPLSLIGTFFIMYVLGYSINLLTLLALVLAIGLVVDDAIIVVENIHRHMEEGVPKLQAAIQGARELANPIIAISVVLIAVYLPIGFMKGLTGALFSEFAFTLAGSVAVSAIVALTLSPVMCSRLLKVSKDGSGKLVSSIDRFFDNLHNRYQRTLSKSLNYISVILVFAVLIFACIYVLFITSDKELAPMEDQGIILAQVTTAPNATIQQTHLFSSQVADIYRKFKETELVFQFDGINGINTSFAGMLLKPWDQRSITSNELQPKIQQLALDVAGAFVAVFQLPPLPGASGLPIQFVIKTTDSFDRLNEVNQAFMAKVRASKLFYFMDTDLKIDKAQANVIINRDKATELGLNMQQIGTILSSALSQNYINYFNYAGRSYQVIPQMMRSERLSADQLKNYYITSTDGTAVPLSTIVDVKHSVVPESLNHFQQVNSAMLSAIAFPGVTLGKALTELQQMAKEVMPEGYSLDYAGQSRQYIQESAALVATFFFAIIIILLSLAALFESFRDPFIVLISVPMSICGALIFISLGIRGANLNIYTEVGLITLIGLISKHGILIVQFANELQREGKSKREAIEMAASIRLRPILMTTAAMVLGVIPLLLATGAGAASRFQIGLVIASGISIGTLFTLFVVPAMYILLAQERQKEEPIGDLETSP